MKRVMVDIETLGVRNDAVVLSIAVVPFEINEVADGIGGSKLLEPIIRPGLVWYPSLREQFAAGRTTSEGTLEWWQQDALAQARAAWAHPNDPAVIDEPIANVYQGFAAAVETADEVWAHGVVFDIGILESLFDRVGPKPWKNYGVIRDVRTIVRLLPWVRHSATIPAPPEDSTASFVAHDPTSDCVTQIWDLWFHWPERKEEKNVPYNSTALGH